MEQFENEDDAAMASLKLGDGAALQTLYHKWKQPLMNYFHRMTGSLTDAEELVLKVIEQLWKTAENYESRKRFPAWLFTLARRQLQHHWRSAARHLPAESNPDLAPERICASNPAQETESAEALIEALQSLPENQREALLLHLHSRLPGEAMAKVMEVPLSHFHVLVHRAKLNLKQHLETYFHA
jgi:RNA polymerase sigma-70 factor (ECF subfamily)